MTHLVPIKVKIGLRGDGHADHPPFNALSERVRSGMDWSHYIDTLASEGWFYDKKCGHSDTDVHNDEVPNGHEHENNEIGCQFGCLLVPEAFALAAVSKFGGSPYFIEIISEASFESFYDERAHAHEDEEVVDTIALEKIKARIDAGDNSQSMKNKQANALNRDHPEKGVKKNHRKGYANYKTHRGIEIRASERKPT